MANQKYAIWNKTDNIYTPVGEELTANQWLDRYGWLRPSVAVPVVAAGLVNGAFVGELSMMKQQAERMGATFADGLSNEELLDAIAEFEDSLNNQTASTDDQTRIADALEDLVVLQMPDDTTTSAE